MKPSAMRSLGFTSAARMREDKIKGAAAAMAVDLMKERRERFRVVFISVDLLSLGWWGERSRERLVRSFAPPQGIDETVCNHSDFCCPASRQRANLASGTSGTAPRVTSRLTQRAA